ncbi:XRE family transcriptional regulator [bacterium 1XD8-76]|nr:XRE family transcriptional regulator [bacterium 1XD8-76]
MANITAKTSSNVFYKARCEAAKYNEQLSSREGAAEIMAIEKGRLYRIEKGNTYPYPEEIRMMADLYNAPELEHYYCKHICPLGADMPEVEVTSLDRASLKTVSIIRKIEDAKNNLLDITEDGVIDESEKPILNNILQTLDEFERAAQTLKLWAKKNL